MLASNKLSKRSREYFHWKKTIRKGFVPQGCLLPADMFDCERLDLRFDLDEFTSSLPKLSNRESCPIIVIGNGEAKHIMEALSMIDLNNGIIVVSPDQAKNISFEPSAERLKTYLDEVPKVVAREELIFPEPKNYINSKTVPPKKQKR